MSFSVSGVESILRTSPESPTVVSAAAPVAGSTGRTRASQRASDGDPPRLPWTARRACARPACDAPAVATLRFSYGERAVVLVELLEAPAPQAYDLCALHAGRTSPPQGWSLDDQRADRAVSGGGPATALGGERTVELLAAALRAAPAADRSP